MLVWGIGSFVGYLVIGMGCFCNMYFFNLMVVRSGGKRYLLRGEEGWMFCIFFLMNKLGKLWFLMEEYFISF